MAQSVKRYSFPRRRYASSASYGHSKYMLGESYTPRRALLYVPMHNDKMVGKVNEMTADCVVLELEDGVTRSSKEIARQNAIQWLNDNEKTSNKYREIAVRVNSHESGLMDLDVAALSTATHQPKSFMIPKVQTPNDVHNLQATFQRHYGKRNLEAMIKDGTNLIICIESGQALYNMPSIIETAIGLHHQKEFFKLDALVFGSDDYCADIEARRTPEATEVMYARQQFVMHAKTWGIQAIDIGYADIKDVEGLERQSLEGQSWGFTGKQVTHPDQVDIVHKSFLPSKKKLKWARDLLEAYTFHEAEGKGAFTYEGKVVNRPLIQHAKSVLKYASFAVSVAGLL